MKYRVKEVEEAGATWYYPQYRKFVFWRNFQECYRGVKWVRWWSPFFISREGAVTFLSGKAGATDND